MLQKNNSDDNNESAELVEEEEEEDCMLCLESMHRCDRQIPMLCPLDGCPFNYCTQCVWNLLLTSSQPYQEASDGSKQLKIPLQCPQCRTKYPHRQVVQDVLLLRQALRLQPLFFTSSTCTITGESTSGSGDSEDNCRASDLSAKQEFLQQVTWEALQEAWARVDKYLRDRSNPYEGFEVDTITNTTSRIPELPPQWKDHLPLHDNDANSESKNSNSNNPHGVLGMGQAQYDIVDPTLFQGMDETMTLSEQEFLSKLMVSGSIPNLMHAAHILHGMLQLMLQGGLKARQYQSLNFSHLSSGDQNTTNTTNGNNYQSKNGSRTNIATTPQNKKNLRMLTTGTKLLYPDMEVAVLRKRFPLPSNMPRWIVLPIYNPDKRGVPLQFKDHPFGLLITSVKGSAGQQGVRKGDIVTHINEESCASSTPQDFETYMKGLYERNKEQQQQDETITLVVNAHSETAEALQKRSFEMIHFLTNREKPNSTSTATTTNNKKQ